MVNGYWEILFCMGIYYLVAVTSSHIPNFSFDCAKWILTNYISLWFLGFSLLSLSLIMLQGNTATFIWCVRSHFGFLGEVRTRDLRMRNQIHSAWINKCWLILYVDIVIGRNLLETSKITVFYATSACAKLKFDT